MKKIVLVLTIIFVGTYFLYKKYYLSGKFNSYLDAHPYSETAQYIDYLIGKLNFMRTNYDGAMFRFNRVINNYFVDKYKLDAYFSLAETYEKINNKSKAIEIYEYLKSFYPDTPQGKMAVKRLEFLSSF
jgi:TolA-binding protein